MDGMGGRAGQLALKIIKYAQSAVLMNMRFLSPALFRFRYLAAEDFMVSGGAALATDGSDLYYDPYALIGGYREEPPSLARALLHTVLHCVFAHPFVTAALNRNLWDLSCDIAIERIISEFGVNSLSCKKEIEQAEPIKTLDAHIKPFTAEKIYRYFLDNPENAGQFLESAQIFSADDHVLWYKFKKQNDDNGDDGENDDEDEDEADGESGGDAESDDSDDTENGGGSTREELKELWKDIAGRIQVDIETFSKEHGDQAGTMMQNIKDVTREKYDYAAFLRRFSVLGEAVRINDEEFEYIYYTYGLKLYGKMPLIEPLEYKEVHLIKDFVVAIDTSGSVQGELVQAFMKKTYNILKQTESFFMRINLYIIQCDAQIQEVKKIAALEEFDDYLKTTTIKGLGGTDFRPVFGYVDELIKKGELANLRGLVYFTDGYGTFPEHKPAYDAAFVFVDEIHGEFINPRIPPWAMKLVLKPDEIS